VAIDRSGGRRCVSPGSICGGVWAYFFQKPSKKPRHFQNWMLFEGTERRTRGLQWPGLFKFGAGAGKGTTGRAQASGSTVLALNVRGQRAGLRSLAADGQCWLGPGDDLLPLFKRIVETLGRLKQDSGSGSERRTFSSPGSRPILGRMSTRAWVEAANSGRILPLNPDYNGQPVRKVVGLISSWTARNGLRWPFSPKLFLQKPRPDPVPNLKWSSPIAGRKT